MVLPEDDAALLEQLGLPTGFGGNKSRRPLPDDPSAGRQKEMMPNSLHNRDQRQQLEDEQEQQRQEEDEEWDFEAAPSHKRRKKIRLSQMTVFSDDLSVRQLLAFYPNGLNYATILQQSATTSDAAEAPSQSLHIKFDEDGEPLLPQHGEEPLVSSPVPAPICSETKAPDRLIKYQRQRYDLFHRYDDGIQIDDEGWFSVTPEAIASHIASVLGARVRRQVPLVWDAFAGVGGNAIQFAQAGAHVIATDLDRGRLQMAAHNATVYGVRQYMDLLQADALRMDRFWRRSRPSSPSFDSVFLSPPWGGPAYARASSFDLFSMLPLDFARTIQVAHSLSPHDVIYYLPRNTDATRLAKALPSGSGSLRLTRYFLADRFKVLLVTYHDNDQQQPGHADRSVITIL